jgi:hypothetical protein
VFEWGNKIVIRELLVVAAAAGVIMAAALGVAPTTGANKAATPITQGPAFRLPAMSIARAVAETVRPMSQVP